MNVAAPDRPVYHITHVSNLTSIVGMGRLVCDAERIRQNLTTTSVGYAHIKQRRLRRVVKVAAGGRLGDYVPFNFCPRSVMLYVLSRGHEGYGEGQQPIVHLVSSVNAIVGSGRPVAFTDRHADLAYARQFDDLGRLDQVHWHVMRRRQWGGDPDLKERRQAEFLVHEWCPWSAISEVGVMDAAGAQQAAAALAGYPHAPAIVVHRDWYY